MAARLHNSEERSNSLRLEAAAMQVRIKSHEDEARTLKDQKARLSQQLKSAQEELDRSRRDAVRNDRAARELHRLLVCFSPPVVLAANLGSGALLVCGNLGLFCSREGQIPSRISICGSIHPNKHGVKLRPVVWPCWGQVGPRTLGPV